MARSVSYDSEVYIIFDVDSNEAVLLTTDPHEVIEQAVGRNSTELFRRGECVALGAMPLVGTKRPVRL